MANLDPITRDGFTVTFKIAPDSDYGTPWENEDGHGPVSDWQRSSCMTGYPSKRPGQLVLCTDHGSSRFYDFAAACRIARRDSWGVAPYSLTWERGALSHGLTRCTGIWFDAARNLESFTSDWHDDRNAAIAQIYAMHRATMTPREYAALAARADYDRLSNWCDDRWHYCGVIATVTRAGITLATASLWGIESDSPQSHFAEIAADLTDEALTDAQAAIAALTE